jgi:DeoR family transcriptional regulator, fructose operon transcriptional repressor
MFQIERQTKIYKYLLENKKATVNSLAEYFDVTPMTIRRDLTKMEEGGLVARTFGGVMLKSSLVTELPYNEKESSYMDLKKKIASAAANLVKDGTSLILDSGTTCMEIAKLICNKKDIRVVTNDILIAAYLMKYENIDLYCTGGNVQRNIGSCIDDTSRKFFENINVELCFVGSSAVHHKYGVSTPTSQKSGVKKAILNASDYKVLVSDSSKYMKKGFVKICDIEEFDMVIVDSHLDSQVEQSLIEKDINIKIV